MSMIKALRFHQKALLFCRVSNAAYKDPKVLSPVAEKLGFKSNFISNHGSEAYVFENDHDIILSCRGTQPNSWDDLKADLQISRVQCKTGIGKVHRGFQRYVNLIWPKVHEFFERESDRNEKCFWITGHSLGAAMGTVMAKQCVDLKILKKPDMIFTFGSPRVGCQEFASEIDKNIIHHRFVNYGDAVSKVPLPPLFAHCGTMYCVKVLSSAAMRNKRDETVIDEKVGVFRMTNLPLSQKDDLTDPSMNDELLQTQNSYDASILNVVFHPFSKIFNDFRAHHIELYLQRLENWGNALDYNAGPDVLHD